MNQTVARFHLRGVTCTGGLSGNRRDFDTCMVAVINSVHRGVMRRDRALRDCLKNIGCVIMMEAHHVPARTWTTVAEHFPTEYRLAMSATPFENSSEPETLDDYRLIGVSGPVIARLPPSVLMNKGHLTTPVVHFVKVGGPWRKGTNWSMIKPELLTKNPIRNTMIAKICSRLGSRRRVLALVSEIEQGKLIIAQASRDMAGRVYMFSGGSKLSTWSRGHEVEEEAVPVDELVNRLEGEDNYLLVGSPALDEDFDLPSADVLVVAAFGKAFRRVVQRAGRVLRVHRLPDGNVAEAHIVDFNDRTNPVLIRHATERRNTYLEQFGEARGFEMVDHRSADALIGSVLVSGEQKSLLSAAEKFSAGNVGAGS